MTWSSTGTAASWPSTKPVGSSRYTLSLTFRINTDAGLCFVVGAVGVPGASTAGDQINATPLPAQFRPIAAVGLAGDSGSVIRINTNGTITAPVSMGATNFRTFYFLDTSPA